MRNTQNKHNASRLKPTKRLLILTSLFIFASAGAYMVFRTQAQSAYDMKVGGLAQFILVNNDTSFIRKGQQFTKVVSINTSLEEDSPLRPPYQAVFDFSYSNEEVKVLTVTCVAAGGCSKSPARFTNHFSESFPNGFGVCISVNNRTYNEAGPKDVFAVTFEALNDDPITFPSGSGYPPTSIKGLSHWYALRVGVAPNSCSQNPQANGIGWDFPINAGHSGGGYCGSVNHRNPNTQGGMKCTNGVGEGNTGFIGFGGTGGNGQNNGQTGNNTGQGSGGGGGSSANQQSNQQNPFPSTSAQGNNDQPEIEPDPFFDGKEFAPGSDTDSLGATVSRTGKKLIHGWYYVIGAIVIGGVGGIGFWYWRQSRLN